MSTVLILVLLLFLVVGLLATYALNRFSASLQDRSDTVARLQRIGDALDAYAAGARRLPCPADPTLDTGVEVQASASTCTHLEGTLPWRTIGLRRDEAFDEWGFKISYRVYVNGGDGSLTQPNGIDMSHCDSGQAASEALAAGRVCTPSSDPYAHNQSAALFLANKGLQLIDMGTDLSNRAYVLISHGESGLGAYTSSGAQRDLPIGVERDNARSGPYVIRAFSDPDTEATKNTHFDDLLFYRTVEDVARRAGLAARDWPEGGRFDAATATAMFGDTDAHTGRDDVTYRGNRYRAQGDDEFSFASIGGVSGIGVTDDSSDDYGLERSIFGGAEYIRIDFGQSASRLAVSLAGFGWSSPFGTKLREQVNFRFYNGAAQVGATVTRQGCRPDGDLATMIVEPSTANGVFTAVEVESDYHSDALFFTSSFLLAEVAACGASVGSCTTSLAAAATTCLAPSIAAAAFSPASVAAGAAATLAFTIANGTDNPQFDEIGFKVTLPPGLVVASPANASTSCAAGTVSATAGAGEASAANVRIANNAASCTVRFDVASATPGAYGIGAAAVSELRNVRNAIAADAALAVAP